MFKEMRRKDRQIFDDEVQEIIAKGEYGILATVNENGYPYTTPLSYVYFDGSIYFHCAQVGQKLDNIQRNNKVSFCIVRNTEVLPQEFATKYESVVIFGQANEVTDELKEIALLKLIEKYSPDFLEEGKQYIENAKAQTVIIKIDIEHVTGKARR